MSILKDLLEVYDTDVPGVWTQEGDNFYKKFEVNTQKYEIHCAKETVDDVTAIIVSFSWINEDGKPSLNLTHNHNAPIKVLAIVKNSVKEKFGDDGVFLFTAKDDPSREESYSKISTYLAKDLKMIRQVESYSGGKVFALSKPDSEFDVSKFI